MAPPTNLEMNEKKEPGCFAVTAEKKYFHVGSTFIKRSLRPAEWQKHNGYHYVPPFVLERILNEGACIKYLSEHTNIPLPKLHACFEDDGAAYLILEYVEGVGMNELDANERKIVEAEIDAHIKTLISLKSDKWGGFVDMVLMPYRIMRHSDGKPLRMKPRETADLVFCHNDLSTHNVIVDPKTLKINAIIDWEYSGFFPPEFEAPFYRWIGASVALKGESNDEQALMEILEKEKL